MMICIPWGSRLKEAKKRRSDRRSPDVGSRLLETWLASQYRDLNMSSGHTGFVKRVFVNDISH